jgi:asparagine synthase (glutamine-hydrolysing)
MERDGTELMWWGIDDDPADGLLLCRTARWRGQRISPGEAGAMLRHGHGLELGDVLPPFAPLVVERGRVVVATDVIGYRHIYVRRAKGWSAASTSLNALTALAPASLDSEALAVQSLLGWQLGERTVYHGIVKVPAGHRVTLRGGDARVERYVDGAVPDGVTLESAVRQAAALLRAYLNSYLDEQPQATLQLSGGQDSRILLSAIDPRRRRGLEAMTLWVPGNEDASIAADLAQREGLLHRVISMEGLEGLAPAVAYELCRTVSRRIAYMANPIANAGLAHAESESDREPRISGLGGEVARGFYYFGPIVPLPVTRTLSKALARWRLFTNESVPNGVLTDDFAQWARSFTTEQVHRALTATGERFWAATDEFYLFQRMQRWAGVIDSASCFQRDTVNPMLDRRFLDLVRALRPQDKQGSRFLGLLQMALDPELGRLPLDGRPAPEVYARGGLSTTWTRSVPTIQRTVKKLNQRARRVRMRPAGGDTLVSKVVAHWRETPDEAAALTRIDVVNESWLQSVLDGDVHPEPSAIAFLLNVATAAADGANSA